jgi:hypothetical protein
MYQTNDTYLIFGFKLDCNNPLVLLDREQNQYASLYPYRVLELEDRQVNYLAQPTHWMAIDKLKQHGWQHTTGKKREVCHSCQALLPTTSFRMISPKGTHYCSQCACKANQNKQLLKWSIVPEPLIELGKLIKATYVLGHERHWRFWKLIQSPIDPAMLMQQTSMILLPDLEPTPWMWNNLNQMPKSALKIGDTQPWDVSYETDA